MFLARAFLVWLLLIAAETIHGILRVIFLEPLFGDFRSRQFAVFTGALIILSISYLLVGWLRATSLLNLFGVGVTWLILTLAFEISLGRFVFELSWERIYSDYQITKGGLLPFGLLILLFSPIITAKLRKLI